MRKILYLIAATLWWFLVFVSCWNIVSASTDITSPNFEIPVGEITPGSVTLVWDDAGETVDNVLMTILEKMILVFWVCSVFIMTIGAGYMIIYHGQDEFLSKWKSIFTSWLIALAVALSAWFIVRLFALLLY